MKVQRRSDYDPTFAMTSPVCEPPRANLKDLRCRISVFGACCDSSVFIRAIRGPQLRHRLTALVPHNRNACHDHGTRSGFRPNPTRWMSSAIVLANVKDQPVGVVDLPCDKPPTPTRLDLFVRRPHRTRRLQFHECRTAALRQGAYTETLRRRAL
jgi:hypothetical protein